MKGPGGREGQSYVSIHHCGNPETQRWVFLVHVLQAHPERKSFGSPGAAGFLVPLLCTTLAANTRVHRGKNRPAGQILSLLFNRMFLGGGQEEDGVGSRERKEVVSKELIKLLASL